VPLASHYGGTCYEASAEATLSSKYPIARYLYIYLNRKPNQSLDPLRAACAVRVIALPPDPSELLGWGAMKLHEAGLTATPGVIESLAEATDGDALAFFGELSRLAAWARAARASRRRTWRRS